MGAMEPEICPKMLGNLSEKHRAKFPATALSYSRLYDAFSEIFEDKKGRKRRRKKILRKLEKPWDVSHFLI